MSPLDFRVGEDGWLSHAVRCPSPNCNDRPEGTAISLVVVHNISLPPGEFGGPYISQLFTNRLDPQAHPYFTGIARLQVSAHLLLRRDGSLVQYVPFDRRAWHAGQSSYLGRENCNDFSIGIELEGTDDVPYTDMQYAILNAVVRVLRVTYPAIGDNMAGHADIAPGRKTDPGPVFDWQRFRSGLMADPVD